MNYIKHLNQVFAMMDKCPHIKAIHISLYVALFRFWNRSRFKNPISINRMEMMQMSKIGSPNTYSKTLKELELYGFIRYHPSFDAQKGSTVHLYTFDTGTCTLPVSKMIPYNKHINNTIYNKGEEEFSESENQNNNPMNKFTPPPIEHIQIYFQQKGHDTEQANRFYNYYESIGWKVGGKTTMKDWKAAARNWILNIPRYHQTHDKTTPTKNTSQQTKPPKNNFSGQNYNEPL